MFETQFCARTVARFGDECATHLQSLVVEESGVAAGGLLTALKSVRVRLGLETLLREANKLAAVRALGLPTGLFADAIGAGLAGAVGPFISVGPARNLTPGAADIVGGVDVS